MPPMINFSWLPPIFAQASERLSLGQLAGSATVCLAVTGLSRSGKTVFATSLIHNLLSCAHNPNRMPLLGVVGERRLIAATIAGASAHRLPSFPYRDNIEKMALPDWPAPTEGMSEIGVEVRFAPASALGRLVSEITGSPANLTIRIVDYPGEWLLDLPLMAVSYAEWSRATIRLLRKGVRAEIARDFLALLAQHRPEEVAREDLAKQLHDRYCAYLLAARDRHGLSFLQPGRFLCRGTLGDVAFLWFGPLAVGDGIDAFAPGTLGALMAERFDVYKREVVARFYEDHFRNYTRQIVLVDVLRALLAGRDAFDDTRLALEDHVPDIQRDHLAALLRNMAAFPALEVRSSSAQLDVTALASVISTAEESQEIDGQRVQVVVGRPVGSNKQSKFFVGNVPIRPPRADAWGSPFLNVPVFEPPAIDPAPVDGIAHINLDLALEFLLGDRLR